MASPVKYGGFKFHKPGCKCRPCESQRRQAETLAQSAGARGSANIVPDPSERKVIDADSPIIAQGVTPQDRIVQYLAIRNAQPELTTGEIARKLGLAPRSLYNIITKATKAGWLKFSDPVSRIENEIIPKVVDNLSYFLDQKDRQTTLETAKGTIFRKYQEEQGISDAAQTVLALRIEIPDGAGAPKVVTGKIVGSPKRLLDGSEEI